MKKLVIMVFAILGLMCSGCISDNEDAPPSTTTIPPTFAPTTTPASYDDAPISATALSEAKEELTSTFQSRQTVLTEKLDDLNALIECQEPDYHEIMGAYTSYDSALMAYMATQFDYYTVGILAEHTETTDDDALLLLKDTIPFGRPDGKTHSFGELNMAAEELMQRRGNIETLIENGLEGEDALLDITEKLDELQIFLEEYYDISIGYAYKSMSMALSRQAAYSDILIRDCNPDCIYLPGTG